ncbi:hypothetical protein [Frankia sp. Cr1]|uniref:hypothetical protein n=1 Tax=Frankia sp. Cr1 TaxID=3073931 RepID=UPI002AD402AA|nr:hypothetical protein [Frankia sp. Cr1]
MSSKKASERHVIPRSPIIYFDGLPGLGKSTAGVSLASQDEELVFIAENNPSPAVYPEVVGLGGVDAARWYMRTEVKRSRFAREVTRTYAVRAVCDKSVLATLAFVYAAARVGWEPASTYDLVRSEYQRDVRRYLPADGTTVLFSGSVSLSLTRRARKSDRAVRPLWFDPAFLGAQTEFFQQEAPNLCVNNLVNLDAAGNREALLQRAAELMHPARASRDIRQQVPDGPEAGRIIAELIDSYVSAHGGTAVFGNRVGPPFRQFGLLNQAFERHLLFIDDGGQVAVQRDAWDDSEPTDLGLDK